MAQSIQPVSRCVREYVLCATTTRTQIVSQPRACVCDAHAVPKSPNKTPKKKGTKKVKVHPLPAAAGTVAGKKPAAPQKGQEAVGLAPPAAETAMPVILRPGDEFITLFPDSTGREESDSEASYTPAGAVASGFESQGPSAGGGSGADGSLPGVPMPVLEDRPSDSPPPAAAARDVLAPAVAQSPEGGDEAAAPGQPAIVALQRPSCVPPSAPIRPSALFCPTHAWAV